MLRSYEMALKTWSEWLEFHIDHNRTQMFFMSMSPTHERYNMINYLIGVCIYVNSPIRLGCINSTERIL